MGAGWGVGTEFERKLCLSHIGIAELTLGLKFGLFLWRLTRSRIVRGSLGSRCKLLIKDYIRVTSDH